MRKGGDLDPRIVAHVGAVVKELVENRYGGSQTMAAEATGISQGQISDLINRKPGKLGLHTLLALREHTGRSLDDILGLDNPGSSRSAERIVQAAEKAIADLRTEIAAVSRAPLERRVALKDDVSRVERRQRAHQYMTRQSEEFRAKSNARRTAAEAKAAAKAAARSKG